MSAVITAFDLSLKDHLVRPRQKALFASNSGRFGRGESLRIEPLTEEDSTDGSDALWPIPRLSGNSFFITRVVFNRPSEASENSF